ncbi:uncharacterized protein ALTATR162_LOCUS6812 [Alternaria atra]|uniref:Thiaminase-2/PQQC domain-containing protein n=1 Tax=Alternaria atra TaxID=119953 RepID=A0A8J2ICF9_9PLEO|nr:uncharacterized protein ALTATR162_LOCUS6812 [Alternaria atra]CAG5165594.1 unnamed protein product [Alternaria atra]
MGRHANPDIRRAFEEFQDENTPSKCNKVRCLHCGFVRAKNTTRQIEHLQDCQRYLASPEAQAHLLAQEQQQQQQHQPPLQNGLPVDPNMPQAGPSQISNGQQPNPNLQVNRRGPNNKRARDGQPIAPNLAMAPNVAPSLTSHLLTICSGPFAQATQRPFLSHAGCGSLGARPLSQWLVQDGHYARGYIRFIGQLLAKIRLPQTHNSQFHPMYRTMDLLISALNNMRREMQFFEITATKYGLALGMEPPTPITRALLDLLVSASSASASLLEGMVVLWASEHCYRSAWQYASSFSSTLSNTSTDSHIVALHQALIPNWTSPAFSKFVEATRTLVDELANITTTRDGKEEMSRCEEIFRQICWLEERFWPEVDGMGDNNESARMGPPMGPMSAGLDNNMPSGLPNGNGIHNHNRNNSMPGPSMNTNNVPTNIHGNPVNGRNSMSGPVRNASINGPMPNGPINAAINKHDNTPVNDSRNPFGLPRNGMESMGQGS